MSDLKRPVISDLGKHVISMTVLPMQNSEGALPYFWRERR